MRNSRFGRLALHLSVVRDSCRLAVSFCKLNISFDFYRVCENTYKSWVRFFSESRTTMTWDIHALAHHVVISDFMDCNFKKSTGFFWTRCPPWNETWGWAYLWKITLKNSCIRRHSWKRFEKSVTLARKLHWSYRQSWKWCASYWKVCYVMLRYHEKGGNHQSIYYCYYLLVSLARLCVEQCTSGWSLPRHRWSGRNDRISTTSFRFDASATAK